MEALSNTVEPYRKYLLYAPVGILLCAMPWFILMKITEKIPFVDAVHLRKTLLAFLFMGAYVYMWTQNSNPHDVEIKENTFADEVFLLLAGGYYLIHTQSRCRRHIAHDFLFLVFIIAVIITFQAGAPANTYGFLVETPTVFLMLSRFVQSFDFTVTWALKQLSVVIYFMSNLGVCDIGRVIFTNESIPVLIKVVFFFLSILQFINIIEEVYKLMGGQELSNALKNPRPQPIIIQCASPTGLCN